VYYWINILPLFILPLYLLLPNLYACYPYFYTSLHLYLLPFTYDIASLLLASLHLTSHILPLTVSPIPSNNVIMPNPYIYT
jgi:hypothetical protein